MCVFEKISCIQTHFNHKKEKIYTNSKFLAFVKEWHNFNISILHDKCMNIILSMSAQRKINK